MRVAITEETMTVREALQKIDDPAKYRHLEPDDYTRAGCFQFVAHEALKFDGQENPND